MAYLYINMKKTASKKPIEMRKTASKNSLKVRKTASIFNQWKCLCQFTELC